MVTVKLTCSPD